MKDCTAYYRSVLRAYNAEKKEYLLYQPRCKMWECLTCGNINRLLWQAKIGNGVEVYSLSGIENWTFITITSHPKLKTTSQCLHVWPSAWKKLSTRLRRKHPGIKYALLPEHHKDGRVHWHMVASHGVETNWLKDNCAVSGLGYQALSSPINDSWAAIMYVSKYISKTIGNVGWPKGLRRISTSQKWPELPPETKFEEVSLDWTYLHQYPAEGLSYLAHEIEMQTGIPTRVLGENRHSVDRSKMA